MSDTATPTTAPEAPATPKAKPVYTWGVGRRKSACARVRIAPGSGKIEINGRTLNEYLTAERDRKAIFGPLEVTNTGGKMDVFVNANMLTKLKIYKGTEHPHAARDAGSSSRNGNRQENNRNKPPPVADRLRAVFFFQ
jgi:hypothetical protein